MLAAWVEEEMMSVDLGDERLDLRLPVVLDSWAALPTASIPAACGGHAEMTAAYRFVDNPKVTPEKILQPHRDATRNRMVEQPVVLLVQDTTELDLTRPTQQVQGAGSLDGNVRVGAFAHVLHAFTPDGVPLGTVHADMWTRDDDAPPKPKSRGARAATPIEDKESYRWVEMFAHARREAELAPRTQFVVLGDSEADIYEVFVAGSPTEEATKTEAGGASLKWIVRACQNRALQPPDSNSADPNSTAAADDDSAGTLLIDRVMQTPVLFTQKITVRGRQAKVDCETRGRRQPRESRETEVEVRATQVTLRAPYRKGLKLPDVTVHVVVVREIDPPAGDVPIEWVLVTTLPIDTLSQIQTIIQYYAARWMIEILFRVLKSGCRVEARRFEQIDRVLNATAIYLIVAWRTLYVCRMGRDCPDLDCEAIFEPAEWKAVWKVTQHSDPPTEPPRLEAMVRLVAQLGGYVNRTRPDPPGPQTIWLGLQRMHDMALCWKLFGPDADQRE